MPLNAPVVLQPASTPPTLGRKRAMILRMSVEAIQALQNSLNEDGGKGPKRPMQIQFGPDGGLFIGGQFFSTHSVPENVHELYSQPAHPPTTSPPPLQLQATVSLRLTVDRVLDATISEEVRKRSQAAEQERTSRKTVYLEELPDRAASAKKRKIGTGTASSLAKKAMQGLTQSTSMRSKGGLVAPSLAGLPPRPMSPAAVGRRTTPTTSSYQAPSPQPQTSSSSSSNGDIVPLRVRIAHVLALQPLSVADATLAVGHPDEREVLETLSQLARMDTGALWNLRPETYREIGAYTWIGYENDERHRIAKDIRRAFDELSLPADAPDRTLLEQRAREHGERTGSWAPKSPPPPPTLVRAALPYTRPPPKLRKTTDPAGTARNGEYITSLFLFKGGIVNGSEEVTKANEIKGADPPYFTRGFCIPSCTL